MQKPLSKDEREIQRKIAEKRAYLESIADFTAEEVEGDIKRLVKLSTFEPSERYWLNTGHRLLNGALGSRKLGLPYGKQYEFRGVNHAGKTALATYIAGMAQQDGAGVGYIDLEDSRDATWAHKLGLDLDRVVKVYPRLVVPSKKKSADMPRLQSAEELFQEAETGMALLAKRGFKKQFWMLDSVANLQTAMQGVAGATGQNMRTRLDRAAFLSDNLPRWAGLAANYNAMIFLINQIRTKQGVVFGNRDYSPGGNTMQHAVAIRASVRRIKHGRLRQGSKVVGIVGLVQNFKNKAGHGSRQDMECAFRIQWNKTPAIVEFMSREEAEDMLGK